MMEKKERLMVGALAGMLLLGGVAAGTTLSYFTQKEKVTNVFTVGDLEVDLKEPEWNPEDGDGTDIYPGYTVYKNPTVKNIADGTGKTQPCYLKMSLRILDENEEQITDEERLKLIRETIRYDSSYTGNFSTTGSASGLTEGKTQGYTVQEIEAFPMVNPAFEELTGSESQNGEWIFAYKEQQGILKENEEVTLFTDIAFPSEWTSAEMEKVGTFSIEVSAEAIQAKGFEDREKAFEALSAKN